MYIKLRTLEGTEYQITCNQYGFFINESSDRSSFNPNETSRTNPSHSHSLVGLVYQISPLFRSAIEEHLNNVLKTDPILLWKSIFKTEFWASAFDSSKT